jgi:hypothetical protein
MRRLISVAVLCGVVFGGSGCATIINGPRQTVVVTSDPSGAAVTVLSGQTVKSTPGVTPIELKLPRRDANLTIRVEKPGCAPAEMRLTRSVSGWVFTNLVAANPLAQQGMDSSSGMSYAGQLAITSGMFATDLLTGGSYKLPKMVDLRFCSSTAPESRTVPRLE